MPLCASPPLVDTVAVPFSSVCLWRVCVRHDSSNHLYVRQPSVGCRVFVSCVCVCVWHDTLNHLYVWQPSVGCRVFIPCVCVCVSWPIELSICVTTLCWWAPLPCFYNVYVCVCVCVILLVDSFMCMTILCWLTPLLCLYHMCVCEMCVCVTCVYVK